MSDQLDDFFKAPAKDVKFGNVWRLGRHLLFCGDSTDCASVSELVGHADLCLTDPPYGICLVERSRAGGRGSGWNVDKYKNVSGDNSTELVKRGIMIARALTDNQVIFGGNHFCTMLPSSRCWIVWNKHIALPSFSSAELAWTSFQSVLKLIDFTWNGSQRDGDKAEEGIRFHPTQKPVGLLKKIIDLYAAPDAKIYDPFAGSGSTLIAAERTGCSCVAVEIDPEYCSLSIRRWEDLTGEQAVLEQRCAI